jgi:uncharacterized membrane protein
MQLEQKKETAMASNDDVFVYIATYNFVDDAWLDYDAVKDLHSSGVITTYDAAVVQKDADGKVHVNKHEKPTQKGAWTGAAVGAVVGILFPPSLIGGALVGAAGGGLIGHIYGGMSRSDMKDLGEALDAGTAALVVVGKSDLAKQFSKAVAHAQKTIDKELNLDAQDFDAQLAAAVQAAQ